MTGQRSNGTIQAAHKDDEQRRGELPMLPDVAVRPILRGVTLQMLRTSVGYRNRSIFLVAWAVCWSVFMVWVDPQRPWFTAAITFIAGLTAGMSLLGIQTARRHIRDARRELKQIDEEGP